MYRYELPVFQGAGLLIRPSYTHSALPHQCYIADTTRSGFTMNLIVKSIEQILLGGIIAPTFRPVSCSVFLPKYPGKSCETPSLCSDGGPRGVPCSYPNATPEDSPFSLHDLSILELQLL
jgi:hypothetical protein